MTSNEEFINELNGLTNRGNNNEIPYKNCFRMVLMGKSKTGKVTNLLIYNFFLLVKQFCLNQSQLVNWLLSRRYDESYCPTIEDFHVKTFKIKGETYRLEILDTSGNGI